MTDRLLPAEVRKFLDSHITSVEQLEILLLLWGAREEAWCARRVSEVIRTSERSAETRLSELLARGLLVASGSDPVMYQYPPSCEKLDRTVATLSSVYAEYRYRVIDAILAKPIDKLRVYADAFRLGKDGEDNG